MVNTRKNIEHMSLDVHLTKIRDALLPLATDESTDERVVGLAVSPDNTIGIVTTQTILLYNRQLDSIVLKDNAFDESEYANSMAFSGDSILVADEAKGIVKFSSNGEYMDVLVSNGEYMDVPAKIGNVKRIESIDGMIYFYNGHARQEGIFRVYLNKDARKIERLSSARHNDLTSSENILYGIAVYPPSKDPTAFVEKVKKRKILGGYRIRYTKINIPPGSLDHCNIAVHNQHLWFNRGGNKILVYSLKGRLQGNVSTDLYHVDDIAFYKEGELIVAGRNEKNESYLQIHRVGSIKGKK